MTVPRAGTAAENQLARLQSRYGPSIVEYLVRHIPGDRRLVEDIERETFRRARQQLSRRPETDADAFGPWLRAVARRLAIDALRSRPAEVRPADLAVDGPGPNSDEVRAALLRLRPDQRYLLLQLYHHGHTPAEVAALANVPVATVESRSHLAKRALRAALPADGHLDAGTPGAGYAGG